MKYLARILLTLIALTGLYHITFSWDIGVTKIVVQDKNTVMVTLSENQNLKQGEIDGELTILGDIEITAAVAQTGTANKVEIILADALEGDTSYSLLTVEGAEGSIDFKTPAGVEGFKYDNISSVATQEITSIEVIDDKNLIITYATDLTASSFKYKLLQELPVTMVEKPSYDIPDLILTTSSALKPQKEYILMIIEMQDVDGNYLEFDTGIYDFNTADMVVAVLPAEDTWTGSLIEEELLAVVEIAETPLSEDEEAGVELNAAGTEDLEEVAAQVVQTPQTGAATWILILVTLVINSIYYLSRRKKMKLA